MNQKIIIDTDPGHDDAMAIMLAVKSRAFTIMAVTTVCGNSTIENTTRNARYILKLLDDDTPVYSGARKPLARDLIQAVVHGESGLDGIDPTNEPLLTNDAPLRIIELVRQNPEEITIVTLGPLTNIAAAIELDPNTMRRVKGIISMAGAFRVAGNKNAVAEFNVFVDPEAAAIVAASLIPLTFVPLDCCNDIQLPLRSFEKISNGVIRQALLAMNKPYIANLGKDVGAAAALMYDVVAVYCLLNPESCEYEERFVQIETEGVLTRGMSVIDLRPVPEKITPNARIVTKIDGAKFERCFIETLSS